MTAQAADRDSRAEALLVEGLDQYFSGNYDEAIHLWTRVLFLDRTHARARAYIARARTAVGERQRRADEMLHSAGELLSQGDLEQARRLLSKVEQTSGADEKVAEMWARVERVERTRRGLPVPPAVLAVVDAVPLRTRRWGLDSTAWAIATAALAVLLATAVASPAVRDWFASATRTSGAPPAARVRPLPVLSSAEVARVRAETLYARGRLAEALQALDRVEMTGATREAADALRVDIQRWLLTPRRAAASAVGPGESEGRP